MYIFLNWSNAYDLSASTFCRFGDTINVASRMCSHGQPNRVHLSAASALLLADNFPEISTEVRGMIHIKGKMDMQTYWLIVGNTT